MTDPSIDRMVEEAARAMGYQPNPTRRRDLDWEAALEETRAALESLGIPLSTLAALKEGRMVAVSPHPPIGSSLW